MSDQEDWTGFKRVQAVSIREANRLACRARAIAKEQAVAALGVKVRALIIDKGVSYRRAAAELGVSPGVVAGHCTRLGLKSPKPYRVPGNVREVMTRLHAQGLTIREIAARMDLSMGTCSSRLRGWGLVKPEHRQIYVRRAKPLPGFEDDQEFVNLDVFETPLEGTQPVILRDRVGCRFPVTGHGADTLFCDAPHADGRHYCDTHHKVVYRRRKIDA